MKFFSNPYRTDIFKFLTVTAIAQKFATSNSKFLTTINIKCLCSFMISALSIENADHLHAKARQHTDILVTEANQLHSLKIHIRAAEEFTRNPSLFFDI